MRSALGSPRVLAALGAGLALLIACVAWFVPYLTRERADVSGVPVPTPFFAVEKVALKPGSQACLADVAFDTDAQVVEFATVEGKRTGPPLTVVAEGGGYREAATIEGGYVPGSTLRADIDPPERSVIGTLCITNDGRRRVELLGTADVRTVIARPTTRIDGVEVVPDISVRFLSSEGGSVLERAGELVDRAAAFKPSLLGAPLGWLILVLVALGVPALALYALLSSFRGEG